jgi:hypothetical protein
MAGVISLKLVSKEFQCQHRINMKDKLNKGQENAALTRLLILSS